MRLNCGGGTMPTKDSRGFLCDAFHIGNYNKSFGLLINTVLLSWRLLHLLIFHFSFDLFEWLIRVAAMRKSNFWSHTMNRDEGAHYLSHIYDPHLKLSTSSKAPPCGNRQKQKLDQPSQFWWSALPESTKLSIVSQLFWFWQVNLLILFPYKPDKFIQGNQKSLITQAIPLNLCLCS